MPTHTDEHEAAAVVRSRRSKVGSRTRKAALLLLDVLLAALVLSAVGELTGSYSPVRVALLSLLLPLALYVAGMYEEYFGSEPTQVLGQLTIVGLLLGTATALMSFAFKDLALSRGDAAIRVLAVLVALPTWRAIIRAGWNREKRAHPVILIGDGRVATAARRIIERSPDLRLDEQVKPDEVDDWMTAASRASQTHRGSPTPVRGVIALETGVSSVEAQEILRMRRLGIDVQHVAELYEQVEERVPVALLDSDALKAWSSLRPSGHEVSQRVKRIVDLIGATFLFIVLGPPAFIAGLAMKFLDRGPLLYRQVRVGKGGRLFEIIKLRSMRVDAEAQTGAVWAMRDDPRIPPVGRFLRVSRLDEVPQLWNVLRGDMSLVGPRPERPEFTEQLAQKIPHFDLRHVVTPGLTGWAQVKYPYGASVKDSERKLEYDLYYIRHWSLWLDLRILLKTVRVVLFGHGGR